MTINIQVHFQSNLYPETHVQCWYLFCNVFKNYFLKLVFNVGERFLRDRWWYYKRQIIFTVQSDSYVADAIFSIGHPTVLTILFPKKHPSR